MSRCQVFSFAKLTAEELGRIALQQKISAGPELLELSAGSAGKLASYATQKSAREEAEEARRLWLSLKQAPLAERLLWVAKLADMDDTELQATFESWLMSQTQALSTQRDLAAAGALLEGLRHFKTNKNKKFIIQSLLMKI
jgi:hypothetical protein